MKNEHLVFNAKCSHRNHSKEHELNQINKTYREISHYEKCFKSAESRL